MGVFLKVGMKGEYIFLPHTSTQIIQIDMQGMTCTQKRSEEPLHGKFVRQNGTCDLL